MAFQVKDVTDLDLAFPVTIKHLMPAWNEIPDEFKGRNNKWCRVFSRWFYRGARDAKFTPKEGVDVQKALRHVAACMGSFEPSHEHKEAGVAYLLNEFFDDITFTDEPAVANP
jgi:hypothetical protein